MTFETIVRIIEGLTLDPLSYEVRNTVFDYGITFTYNGKKFSISGFVYGDKHTIQIEQNYFNVTNKIEVTEVQYLKYKLLLETLKEKLRKISENFIDDMFIDEDTVESTL
jgi:hypothetical protein